MEIHPPCVAELSWELRDGQGEPLERGDSPRPFLVGGDDLLPALEAALEGKAAGDEVLLRLEPEQAFGDYDASLVCFEARALFPERLEAGMQFEGLPAGAVSQGMPAQALYTVTEVYPAHVVLDANHPLAGMALQLRAKVHAVRAASAAERDARSAGQPWLKVAALAATPPQRH